MASQTFQTIQPGFRANNWNYRFSLNSDSDNFSNRFHVSDPSTPDNEFSCMGYTNFKGWGFTAMRDIFIINYSSISHSVIIFDRTEDVSHLHLSGPVTPEDSLGANEVSNAINSFSDDYRIPFSMHAIGYRYSEIADKMNLPVGVVKSRIFSVYRKLKERIACNS